MIIHLSIVLATRNNAGTLSIFLESLLKCRKPATWELIVVDNGSTDHTSAVLGKYKGKLPLTVLYESVPGKSRCLNRGIQHASGEILLFTDDDVIPDNDWLLNHVRVMDSHPEIDIAGGRILVEKSRLPVWLTRSFNLGGILVTEHDLGDSECIYGQGRYPYGPNMAVRKVILAGIDSPWPEHIGPGTAMPVGDEMMFVDRICSSYNKRLYAPDCIVEHRPDLPVHFFFKSLKRCFLGGYVAGLCSESLPVAGYKNSLIKLTGDRVWRCRSIRELFCITSRATGYYIGRIFRKSRRNKYSY